jgi:hypothetical protein
MHPLIQLHKAIPIFVVSFVFACFGFSPTAQAVTPPPDGGYPGGNTAEGNGALLGLRAGISNTAVGNNALTNLHDGDFNTATGAGALGSNFRGNGNVAVGNSALAFNGASFNTAIGLSALHGNQTGHDNTANGRNALFANTTGNYNAASGVDALSSNTSGERNTAIGFNSLEKNTTGSFNVALGAGAGSGVITADDVICIGRGVVGANVGGTCFIGNIRGVTTQNANALPVLIDGAGQLGTANSSRRYKTDIKPMDKASETILALKPVSFRYKVHKDTTPQFGLIAEEVAQVNPELVIYDADGKPFTVRYDAVNAMLLNEFIKEHRKVEQLEKQIEALTAGLQKVSAQLETSKPAPQVVNNP